MALILIPAASSHYAFAVPAANQFVPVAVIATNAAGNPSPQNAFGVAYDPINDLIWATNGGTPIQGFDPVKNQNVGLLPNDPQEGLPLADSTVLFTTPNPHGGGLEALGFDPAIGQILMYDSGFVTSFDPFTAGNLNPTYAPCTGCNFLDGLDENGGDVHASPENGSRDSLKNGAIFLDNTSVPQTDIQGVWVPNGGSDSITRWAGVEVAGNFIYTTAEVNNGAGRTIATYDLLGNLVAIDPDGHPGIIRFEDLAYDGRYLYGASLGDNRIFVFDIVGPGSSVPDQIGGEIMSINTVSLALAGATANAALLIPMIIGIAGAGAYFTRSYWNKSEE